MVHRNSSRDRTYMDWKISKATSGVGASQGEGRKKREPAPLLYHFRSTGWGKHEIGGGGGVSRKSLGLACPLKA